MSKKTDAFDPRTGFKVAHKRCDQCLFSKGKIVSDDRRKNVLAECEETQRYFICHKATMRGDAVVCRGFFDEAANRSCQVAERLGLVVFVDPATGEIVHGRDAGSKR